MKARCNGLDLEVEVFGEGPALLLIMGIGAQLYLWPDSMVQAWVERGYRVVRFDHRDIGRSTWLDDHGVPDVRAGLLRRTMGLDVEAPYDLSDMALDCVGLLDALELPAAHVLGISMGGMVAQHLAIEHPSRVLSLTSLMSTTGARRYVLRTKPAALKALLAGPAPQTAEQSVERLTSLMEVIGSPGPRDLDELSRVAHLCFPHTHPRGFLRHFAAILASGDRTEALGGVSCPSQALHGSLDPLIHPSAGEATARAIPGARFELFEGMGHDMPPSFHARIIDAVDALARG